MLVVIRVSLRPIACRSREPETWTEGKQGNIMWMSVSVDVSNFNQPIDPIRHYLHSTVTGPVISFSAIDQSDPVLLHSSGPLSSAVSIDS